MANSGTIAPIAGTVAAGCAGTFDIFQDLTLSSTSKLEIEIGGTSQGTQYDLLRALERPGIDRAPFAAFRADPAPVGSVPFRG